MYLSIFLRAGALFTIALLRNRSLLRGIFKPSLYLIKVNKFNQIYFNFIYVWVRCSYPTNQAGRGIWDKYYNYVQYIQWEIYIHVSKIINHAFFVMKDFQNIISCVLFVIKRYTMNVNIILIGDTIPIIAPYVSKQIPYTTNSVFEMLKHVKWKKIFQQI